MTRFALVTFAAALASLGAFLTPAPHVTLAVVASAYAAAVVVGVTCIRAQLFLKSVCRLRTRERIIALTFDDGPDPGSTPPVLDLLDELDVPAAFFCIGSRVRDHPGVARSIVRRGHVIGNHSFNHPWWMNLLVGRALANQIEEAQRAIEKTTGIRPTLYRSPMGLTNPHLGRRLRAAELRSVGWTIRGFDTWPQSPQRVARRVLKRLRPGAIIVLHDGGRDPRALCEAIRLIVDGARRDQYTLVRLDRFLVSGGTAKPILDTASVRQ